MHVYKYTVHAWNPSITDTFGEHCFGLYTEVAFVEGLFCIYTNCSFGTWVPGRYIAAGIYSEVVLNTGSTVLYQLAMRIKSIIIIYSCY